MKKGKTIFTIFHRCSALFMILALLWLTVSTPYIMTLQEAASKEKVENNQLANGADENPLNTNTEEKVPASNTFSEEYLHDHNLDKHFIPAVSEYHKCENADIYIAYHGELLVPPPDAP